MDKSLEIRKLSPKHVKELAEMLEYSDSWKHLMAIIPKVLHKEMYICDINKNNLPKYNSEHFKAIENAGSPRRTCSEILFDEWGTSGRVRPALGHLLYLLSKAQLFRAADYVAMNILKEKPPQRPQQGPAAPISVDILEATEKIPNKNQELVLPVPNLEPSSINNETTRCFAYGSEKYEIHGRKSQSPHEVKNAMEVSDMIKFSKTSQLDIPEDWMHKEDSNVNSGSPERFSSFHGNSTNMPDISLLLRDDSLPDNVITNLSKADNSSASSESCDEHLNNNVMSSKSFTTEDTKGDTLPEGPIPDFAALFSKEIEESSNIPENISLPCISPLPNLQLDTTLPHFSYTELEKTTNNFNNEPYATESSSGRLLGSGAFGSVYLSLHLLSKPVAVKKLHLENTELVTKQFRTEVELLSRYKHENLLPLLGYSADGLTYCILYEYMPGGTLENRLKGNENILQWQQRIRIASGTADAISYLHTAFSTPLIHRDIKSANILLDTKENPNLGDFGIMKLLPDQTLNEESESAPYGTSAYMAPEAHCGDISEKLDTYSFGVVLMELLTSLPPVNSEGWDIVSYIEDHIEQKNIETVLDIRTGNWTANGFNYAQKLSQIGYFCLEEKKDQRPSMKNISEDLTELVVQLGT